MANEIVFKNGFVTSGSSSVSASFSATTYYSGSTELSTLIRSIASSSKNPITLMAAGAWTPFTSGATGISQVESTTNKVNYFVVDFLPYSYRSSNI